MPSKIHRQPGGTPRRSRAPDGLSASAVRAAPVTCVVQVDGKVRDRLTVDPKATAEELERRARDLASVKRTVGDREIANVIVRPPRLVNIVTR